ncbi:hypothetical protein cyc_04695 [Cyclospora cayetanensis]|uniref:Phosphatidylinositol N-acetylglucosaminyltransferase subunit H conserved domain-containing protein n=1 Tax=Cyclospora cayetanensis TaxID=88456 RepID=A0A1D3CYF9_9EIME|nr:hypothetical protein cyc_04695 [Cyclospora cayetanensis]
MQTRQRRDCTFWASPWNNSYRTFAAFSDPANASAAAAAEYADSAGRGIGGSNTTAEAALAKFAQAEALMLKSIFRGKLLRILRAALPIILVCSTVYSCSSLTGPLPQVLFLIGAFFSCIPLANMLAAIAVLALLEFSFAEQLTIIGDFGVQLSCRRLLGSSKRFLPMSQVRDVLICEEVNVYRVAYHVALIVGDEQEIIVPFQDFDLRLEDCLAAYEALHCLLKPCVRGKHFKGECEVQTPASAFPGASETA